MRKRCVRIDVTSQQYGNLRQEIFCDQQLSVEGRRRKLAKLMPLPKDGSPVDLYCDGDFIGTV